MYLTRRKFLTGVSAQVLFLAAAPNVRAASVGTATCAAPNRQTSDQSELSIWDDDTSYDLRVDDDTTNVSSERKRIHYIADILQVSPSSTASLIRAQDGPASNVDTITFDARRVLLNGSLAFNDANVVVIGQKFEYGEDAMLSLFAGQPHSASLRVYVYELRAISDPYVKPFGIYYDSNGAGPDIEIYAQTVWVDDVQVVDPMEAQRAVWQLIGASDDADQPSTLPVTIQVGDAAVQQIDGALASQGLWPAAVYEKALRLQSAYPFDCNLQQDIVLKQAETQPFLEKTALAQAASGFPILVARVEGDLDAFGHGPNWAPRKALTAQLKSFQDMLAAMTGSANGLLSDDLIAFIAAGFDNAQPDPSAVHALEDKRDSIQADIEDLDGQIDANLKATMALSSDFKLLQEAITQNQTRIAQETIDEEKRLNDAAAAKQGFATVGTIVGVATSFIGTPAAGAAVGAAFNAVGDIVYNHNTGGSLNLTSIEQIVTDTSSFYNSMNGVISKWQTLVAQKNIFLQVMSGQPVNSNGSPVSQMQAASKFGSAVLDFGKSVQAITKNSGSPVPQPLSLTQKENLDPTLQQYLELLSDNQAKQAKLTGELAELNAKRTSDQAERDQTVAALQLLLNITPVNDQDFARWTQWARYLWISDIRTVVQAIYILQRAFGFEIGKDIPVLSGLSSFPATIAAAVDAGHFDVLAPGTIVKGNDVKAYLQAQRARVVTSAQAVYQACLQGIETYLSTNQRPVTFERGVEFRRLDLDPNRRAFVEAINAQIEILIARQRSGYTVPRDEPTDPSATPGSPAASWNLVNRPRLIPLYIPFIFEPPEFSDEAPLRFVRARVGAISWTRPNLTLGYDGLSFTIIHPGYGELGSVENPRFIDLRENNAINEIRNITTMYQIASGTHDLAPIEADIGATYYTYPPARSNYFLAVDITSSHWIAPPQIEELVLVWELFQ